MLVLEHSSICPSIALLRLRYADDKAQRLTSMWRVQPNCGTDEQLLFDDVVYGWVRVNVCGMIRFHLCCPGAPKSPTLSPTLSPTPRSSIGRPISVVSMNMCAAENARKNKWDNFTLVANAYGDLSSKVFNHV